jgi:CCR4-NOT transcription complex subunit 4
MQKKTRREIQKAKERAELESVAPKVEPEAVEVAPIMGRKKKQKKERVLNSATATSTPSASRPPSPSPAERIFEEPNNSKETPEEVSQVHEKQAVPEPEVARPANKLTESKGKGKAKVQRAQTPEAAPNVSEVGDEVTEKPVPTPASVLQELIASGMIPSTDSLNLLKNPSVSFKHQDTAIDMQSVNQKLTITPEDRAALLAGQPVHKIAEGPNRIMLTPNGDCVRNLTEQEEQRYLDLQARIAEEAGPTAFVSAKYHGGNGFTLIGGRAVPNGPPAFFPVVAANAPPMDPVSKIQRDEALSYINQYVLPSLSTNSQLEKALNANALDTDLLRSGDASNWAAWGNDVAAAHPENGEGAYGGASSHDGMLGLESMTAHFAVGGNMDRGQPLGNVSMLGLTEAESALQIARKEAEGFEKRLNALLKKNRKLLLGSQH